ncbi:MAG: lysylphosphatidylglycerol synthase transmembrane domain-containing protein [Chloroflexota bacterium]
MQLNNWRLWFAVAVSALLLIVLVLQVEPGKITRALRQANYAYVAPAIALYFAAVYFRAVRWRYLLAPLRRFPVRRLYPVVVIGYMANNLLPFRLGELVRSYYLARQERFNTSTTLATVAVERVYDGLTLLAFAALAGPVLLLLGEFDSAGDTSRTTWIIVAGLTAALFAGALIVLTLLATRPRYIFLADRVLGHIPDRWGRNKAQEVVRTFIQGLGILSSPRKHLALFLLSLPVWLLESGMYLIVSYSFGIDDYFGSAGTLALAVVLLTATSNLVTSFPAGIGGIGPFELVAQQTLLALGVVEDQATAYALVLHLVALWLPVNILGLALLWKQNISLAQLAGQSGPSAAGKEPANRHSRGAGPAEPVSSQEELL